VSNQEQAMERVSSLTIERFKRLPRVSSEVWQGGLVRLPTWVDDAPDGRPYRPWGALWVSRTSGTIHLKMESEPVVPDWSLAFEALLEFGLKHRRAGCRPAGLEVRDEVLGGRLHEALGDKDLTVTVSPSLPAIRSVLSEMAKGIGGGPLPPEALGAPGVTEERMRGFADAAKRFYDAAPWRHLTDEDLIVVEAPTALAGLQYVTVLGAGGQTYGLGFFDSAEEHAALLAGLEPAVFLQRARWSVWFGEITEMPFGDADLWEDHRLPVAGDNAYPVAIQVVSDDVMRRPDARTLAYLEGLLAALAETTEDQIDHARWSREVQTCDGPMRFQLCLPGLLAPLDAPQTAQARGPLDRRAMERFSAEIERFMAGAQFRDLDEANEALRREFSGSRGGQSSAATPLERAQDLAFRAFEARGRRRVQLARKALELSADCADAYVVLAEQTSDLARARDWYAQGVAAGERALGARTFAEQAGSFWGLITTRPYMRARLGLAQCLEQLGKPNEAIAHYQELLRLNPNDNQGVRDLLFPALLTAGRDEEAGVLLRQYEDDATALWHYGWALWAFRREGDSPAARDRLRLALRANRRVPKYLSGEEDWRDRAITSYALGSDEEAVVCARALDDAWRGTPGAQQWLASRVQATKTRRRQR